jgi:hypothetical protein
MPAYLRLTIAQLVCTDTKRLIGQLETAHARDGFATQYRRQTKAWAEFLPILQRSLEPLVHECDWTVLLEFPIYRLRHRIDIVLLVEDAIVAFNNADFP